jgi:hypothetical protein
MFGLVGLDAVEEAVVEQVRPVAPGEVNNAHREAKREARENQQLTLQTLLVAAAIGTLLVTLLRAK